MNVLASMTINTKEIYVKNNELPAGQFTVNPRFLRTTNKNGNTGRTELTVEILDTPENRFPVDIRVTMEAQFDMQQIPEDQRDNFLDITAVQLLFPYMRSLISAITTSALMPAIVFPVIDVRSMFNDENGHVIEDNTKKKVSRKKKKKEAPEE